MTEKKVWFITGAGRGMGIDIAQTALAAGHAVVATGRNTDTVAQAVGKADDLLVVELDITSLASAEAAVQAAVEHFGRIDVLVNNAGNFYAGYFEDTKESTAYADLSIDDYAERTAQTRPAWEAMSGKQTNDPAKLAPRPRATTTGSQSNQASAWLKPRDVRRKRGTALSKRVTELQPG